MLSAGMEACEIQPEIADIKRKMVVKANNKLNNWKRIYGVNRGYSVWKEVSADKSKPSGFGFSFSHTYYGGTRTGVGARLEVGTHEEAMYIAKDFEDLFEIAWLIIPDAADAASQDMQTEK